MFHSTVITLSLYPAPGKCENSLVGLEKSWTRPCTSIQYAHGGHARLHFAAVGEHVTITIIIFTRPPLRRNRRAYLAMFLAASAGEVSPFLNCQG